MELSVGRSGSTLLMEILTSITDGFLIPEPYGKFADYDARYRNITASLLPRFEELFDCSFLRVGKSLYSIFFPTFLALRYIFHHHFVQTKLCICWFVRTEQPSGTSIGGTLASQSHGFAKTRMFPLIVSREFWIAKWSWSAAFNPKPLSSRFW